MRPIDRARGPRASIYIGNGPHLSHLISIEPLGGGRLRSAKTERNLAVGSANVSVARVFFVRFASHLGPTSAFRRSSSLRISLYLPLLFFLPPFSLSLSLSLSLSFSPRFANAPSDYYSPPPAASRRAHSRLGLANARASRHPRGMYAGFILCRSEWKPTDQRTSRETYVRTYARIPASGNSRGSAEEREDQEPDFERKNARTMFTAGP